MLTRPIATNKQTNKQTHKINNKSLNSLKPAVFAVDRYELGVAGEDEPVSTEADGGHDCFGVMRRRRTHTRGGAEFCRARLTSPPPQVHAPLEKVQNVHKLCRLVTEEGFCCKILTFNPLNSDVTIQY